ARTGAVHAGLRAGGAGAVPTGGAGTPGHARAGPDRRGRPVGPPVPPGPGGIRAMRAIEVRALVKRYRGADHNAVDGVSFDVPEGQFFGLLGPNGGGKTTVTSILTTTLAPTSGSVRIAGCDLAADPTGIRRRVGVVFQQPSLDANLTGEENVR